MQFIALEEDFPGLKEKDANSRRDASEQSESLSLDTATIPCRIGGILHGSTLRQQQW